MTENNKVPSTGSNKLPTFILILSFLATTGSFVLLCLAIWIISLGVIH